MFEYNVNRNNLIIREYGRNIQKMIEDTLKEPDYQKRSEKAKAIVRMMALINPDDKENKNQKESLDYWHKLWDHLFIMSDYKLDVDSPFPKPEAKKEELSFMIGMLMHTPTSRGCLSFVFTTIIFSLLIQPKATRY